MKAALVAWLERRWYGSAMPEAPLRALAWLVEAEARRRRARHLRQRAGRSPDAVAQIVIGNLAVGGTGKTPLTIALVQALRDRGWRPGVISRGYGGSAVGPERVYADSDPARVGDEPCLIARRTGVPLAIARRRTQAAALLTDAHEVDVLIADDGLQHYALARDLEICVIDGRRRFGNGRLLPAGPLREPAERAAACDFIVVNGGDAVPPEVPMRLHVVAVEPLRPGAVHPLSAFAGQRVHAVAGIGDPERFFATLRAHAIEVLPHAFVDHHRYRAADLAFGDALPVLMTEKDAVKCAPFADARMHAVPVQAQLPDTFFDAVDARLRACRGAMR